MNQQLGYEEAPEGRKFDEQTVQEILALAARLQDREGEKISEERMAQIADEAGLKPEYVRMALNVIEQREQREAAVQPTQARERKRVGQRLRERYERTTGLVRHVVNGVLSGLVGGLGLGFLAYALHLDALAAVSVLASVILGIANTFRSKNPAWGALSGAGWAVAFVIALSLFGQAEADVVVGAAFGGLFCGFIIGAIGSGTAGAHAPMPALAQHSLPTSEDRQELLRQLYSLQDRLRQGTRNATFLSVDVVNSTGMKASMDPLAVEFSFGAYHRYVAEAVTACGGQVHNTAGDGVTCVFESPEKAYQAARLLVRNLGKLNSEHNRLVLPFAVRCGIHSGSVVAPAGDLRGIEFAHVIDVAAHLQKAAPPGGIVVSDASFTGIVDPVLRLGLTPFEAEGQQALLYRSAG